MSTAPPPARPLARLRPQAAPAAAQEPPPRAAFRRVTPSGPSPGQPADTPQPDAWMYAPTPILGVPVISESVLAAAIRCPQLTPDDLRALAMSSTELGVWEWQLDGGRVRYSSRAASLLGVDPTAQTLEAWIERVHPFDAARLGSVFANAGSTRSGFHAEHRVRDAAGSFQWVKMTGRVIEGRRVVGTIEDVHSRKANEVKVRELELRDRVTGLWNRTAFLQRLDTSRAGREAHGFDAVLCIGVDDLERLAAGLGQRGIDDLLRHAGDRLGRWLDRPDVLGARVTSASLGRVGAADLAIHLTSVRSGDELQAAADGVVQVMREPLYVGEHEVVVMVHVGIATSIDAHAPAEMLDNARAALTQARAEPKARVAFYSLAARTDALDSVRLASELRSAALRGELYFEYQPLVDLRSGHLAGLEALMRWRHPECGIISPSRFIPLAEQSELGQDLGLWTVDQVCRQVAAWERIGLPADFSVNANLSASHISDPTLPARVAGMLGAHGVDGRRLKLEITESALVPNAQSAVAVVRALRLLGVRIAIDDFGTGYSSLAQLHRFEIDVLKIDRSFVAPLDGGGSDAIARSVIALARSLELGVVAEGIETVHAMQRLANLGCHLGQGFLFSRPVGPETVTEWLSQTRTGRRFFETGDVSELGVDDASVPPRPHSVDSPVMVHAVPPAIPPEARGPSASWRALSARGASSTGAASVPTSASVPSASWLGVGTTPGSRAPR